MKLGIILLLASLSLLFCAESASAKPNIIMILADDLCETKNLAAPMPEKVAEMQALVEKLITD